MIKFDPNLLRVEFRRVKSITTSLGGAAYVVKESPQRERETTTRISVPTAIARQFMVDHKVSTYLHPVWTAFVYYDTEVVALERHPAGAAGIIHEFTDSGRKVIWEPQAQKNINKILQPKVDDGPTWYIDGRYVYRYAYGTPDRAVTRSSPITDDKKFRAIEVDAFPLHQLNNKNFKQSSRYCVVYVASGGAYSISAPIWKDLYSVGKSRQSRMDAADEDDTTHTRKTKSAEAGKSILFDRIDKDLLVNLAFALKAAGDLSVHWGQEPIEAVGLPQLMVRLNTVNLPTVAKNIKSTFDSGMSFKVAMAWLLGYQRRVQTLEEMQAVRGVMKYLTTKGLYHSSMFKSTTIFKEGRSFKDIDNLSKSTAEETLQELNEDPKEYHDYLKKLQRRRLLHPSSIEPINVGEAILDSD